MPGAAMPIFNTIQPVAGVDIHKSLPPVPIAPLPHYVVWGVGLSGWLSLPLASGENSSSKATATEHMESGKKPVLACMGHACGRGHDGGPHLGHIAGNTLLPLIALGASSKAEFASGTVKTPQGNMAVNCFLAVNLQLHCFDPVPIPSGLAITIDYTVCAGFTWKDFFNGLVHMLVDVLIEALLSVIVGTLTNYGAGRIAKLLGKEGAVTLGEAFLKTVDDMAGTVHMIEFLGAKDFGWPGFKQMWVATYNSVRFADYRKEYIRPDFVDEARDAIIAVNVGGPTGGDMPYAPYKSVSDPIDDAIDGLFYP